MPDYSWALITGGPIALYGAIRLAGDILSRAGRRRSTRNAPSTEGKRLTGYTGRLKVGIDSIYRLQHFETPPNIALENLGITVASTTLPDGTPVFYVTRAPGSPPRTDLMEVTDNEHTGAAVRHLAEGFDDLFRSLGPPPPALFQDNEVPAADGGGGAKP